MTFFLVWYLSCPLSHKVVQETVASAVTTSAHGFVLSVGLHIVCVSPRSSLTVTVLFASDRATHARMPAPVEVDGMGRWIKNTMVSTKVTPAQRLLPKAWMAPGGIIRE
jgi:hypothetical protein